MFCVWSGIIFVVLIASALILLAGFFPPPSPSLGSGEVIEMLSSNLTSIRLAMILLMIGAGFYMIFITVVAHYVSTLEGRAGVLTMLISLMGLLNFIAFSYPCIWWLTAVFRLENNPEIIHMLNDMAWLEFLGFASPTMVLLFSLAVVAFVDKRPQPLFPRWFGYFNIWALTMYLPGQLIFFFKEGIFAWDGLVGFWLVAVDFFSQLLLTIFFLWKAVNREKRVILKEKQ